MLPSRFVPSSKVSSYFLSKAGLQIKALPDSIDLFQGINRNNMN